MNYIKYVYFVFVLLHSPASSQNTWFHYGWEIENYDSYDSICREAYEHDMNAFKDNPYVGDHYQDFCFESYTELFEELHGGELYLSFGDGEKYIKRVMEKVVNDTSITNHVKILFKKDSYINAAMWPSGLMTINVGMLARLNNEAELAILLGHEVAHFVHEDGIKMQGKQLDMSKYGVWAVDKTLWYSREQESSADYESLRYVIDSPYSLSSAGKLYRLLKRDEIRNEIKYGKGNEKYSTHPDPGNRLNMVRNFSIDSLDQDKRNFLVDSSFFFHLKNICYMESVNIDFLQNNVNDLISYSFSRYLMDSHDADNLAVLIEAIRRYLILTKPSGGGTRSFILSEFQKQKDKVALTHYGFLLEKNPSILNHLSNGLVDVWREDLINVECKELMDPEIIEFTTYTEAYEYFKKVAETGHDKQAEHYKYIGPDAEFSDVDSYIGINSIFSSNDYLAERGSLPKEGKSMAVVFPLKFSSIFCTGEPPYSAEKRVNLNREILKVMNNEGSISIYGSENLGFPDQDLVRTLFNMCWERVNVAKVGTNSKTKENWLEVNPELYAFFKRRQVTQVYLCFPYIQRITKGKDRPILFAVFYKIALGQNGKSSIIGEHDTWEFPAKGDDAEFYDSMARKFARFIRKSE